MSANLIIKTINSDCTNYESLLPSLVMIKTTLECDSNGMITGIGYDIIKKLFHNGHCHKKPNGWFDFEFICDKLHIYSCFKNKKIYYNKLVIDYESESSSSCCEPHKCQQKILYKLCYYKWKPQKSICIKKALKITGKCPNKLNTFKEIVNVFIFYLAYDTLNKSYDDILEVINALCDIIKQRIFLDKILKKKLITTFDI